MGEEEVVCVQASENGKNENNKEESRTELKRDYNQCIADTVDNNTEPDQSPNKKQVKEASNDEVRSEVTNPNTSATENGLTTFHDISSQPSESANVVECGELTSTCLENSSSSDETLSHEAGDQNKNNNSNTSQNDNKDASSAAAMPCVVMEIPKQNKWME